jgi:predicted nucleic acid-binding protein
VLTTSRLALVEVVRAVGIANPSPEARAAAEHLVESCLLIDPTEPLVRAAAELASLRIRTLDAIHLASARRVGVDAMLVYDARLKEAATQSGISTVSPATAGSR